MKKLLSKILPCLLLVLLVLGITSCKQESKYAHPSVEPNISNGSAEFLKLKDKTITNQTAYNRLLQTYGLTTLINWVDEITLADVEVDEDAYQEQLNFIIYGTKDLDSLTEDEKKEAYEKFEKDMFSQGYETEEAWKAYYKLEYKRYAYGLAEYEKHILKLNEDEKTAVLTDEDYQVAYETLYQPDYSAVILTFDSEYEAKQILSAKGIDLSKLALGWVNKSTGVALTAAQIKDLFIEIHETINPDNEAIQEYKFDGDIYANELAAISATINNKVNAMEPIDEATDETARKCYTVAPLAFGSRYYLALKVSETEITEKYEDATDEQKDAVLKYLLESSISSNFLLASAQLKALAGDNDLVIYDEALEIGYKLNYANNIEKAGVKADEYKTTTEENAKVVAKLTYNGKVYELNADDLYARLSKQYGPALSLLYIQEYIVLSNPAYNKVTNYFTGEVLDSKLYEEYKKSAVTSYKTSLEKGDYASKGFPANYDWDKFLVDYLGVNSEEELMNLYGSALYSAAEGYFIKDIYLDESKNDEGETVYDDTKVQEEMDKIFNEFFSATMIGVYAYYDKADKGLSNGKADEMTEEQQKLATELVEAVYAEAKERRNAKEADSLAAAFSEIVKEYKSTAASVVTNQWKKYKEAGLQLTLVSSTTYTNASTADEAILDEARKQWDLVNAFKDDKEANPKGISLLGQTLDPGYRNVESALVTYIQADAIADKSSAFMANNAAYRLVITKATDHTYIKKSDSTFKPTYQQYSSYLKDTSNVSSAVSTAIKTYYTPAISNLTTSSIVSNLLFNQTAGLIDEGVVTFGDAHIKEVTIKVIENSITEE